MSSAGTARTLLLLDAVGCALSAGLIAVAPSVLRPVDPSLRSRWPIVAALTVTSLTCATGARSRAPSPGALCAAATLNGGWVAVCVTRLALNRTDRLGTALVATTAALDAATGSAQWALGRRRSRDPH